MTKRDYYKNHVDRRVRLRKLIYFLIFLTVFGITLYDSFVNTLPFHYILFLLVGRVMAGILNRTLQVKQSEEDSKLTVEWNIAGILIIITVIILRAVVFPRILTQLNVVYVSDAILLIIMGWFLGRIRLLSDKIEEMAFTGFLQSRPPKTDIPPENEPMV
ncbi:MAG: hypothetical protein JW885_16665 [Deltaproteobacteria bacterium]|nr:hypothetical protein [Candidatus Zymogenaceae bacterium]